MKNPCFFFSFAQDSHFELRMKWISDFHVLLNRDHFKNPKPNQNKSKFFKLFLILEFSQHLLVCVSFETILKLPVFLLETICGKLMIFDMEKSQIDYIYFFVHNQKYVGRQKCYVK